MMKIGADFLLHRWDREQDENGDVTAASVSKRFLNLYTESFAGEPEPLEDEEAALERWGALWEMQ